MPELNLSQASGSSTGQPAANEGLYIDELAEGSVVDVETQNRHYRLVKRSGSHVCISGHPRFCPEPVDVEIAGSVAADPGVPPKKGYIGRGMFLIIHHPKYNCITTSRVRKILQLK